MLRLEIYRMKPEGGSNATPIMSATVKTKGEEEGSSVAAVCLRMHVFLR